MSEGIDFVEAPALGRGWRLAGWSALFLSLAAAGVCLWLSATARGYLLDHVPFNGTFQNYDPMRRLLSGQVPGRDFTLYLGFGPAFAAYPLFVALGGDYAASNVAHGLASGLAFLLCPFLLLRFAGVSRLLAASLSCAVWAAVVNWTPPWTLATLPLVSLPLPNDSAMGLRTAWGVLPIAFLAWMASRFPSLTTSLRFSAWLAWFFGALAGAGMLWSNDWGASTAVGIGVLLLLIWRLWTFSAVLNSFIFFVFGIASGFLGLVVLIMGEAGPAWIRENYVDVASAQDWFFLMGFEQKAFSLDQIIWPEFAFLAFFVATLLGVRHVRNRSDVGSAALAAALTAAILGAYLPSVLGTGQLRYFAGLVRVMYVAIPAALLLALLDARPILRERLSGPILRRFGVVLAVFLSLASTAMAGRALSTWDPKDGPVAVPELGAKGSLSWFFGDLVEAARRVRVESDAAGLPPDGRVFSFYSSAFDVIAGARQPTRQDYVIHALGERNSTRYEEILRESGLPWATTLNPHVVGWQEWISRASWPTHRALFLSYAPERDLGTVRLWRRRETALVPEGRELSCAIRRISPEEVELSVSGVGLSVATLTELTFRKRLDVEPSGVPIIGSKGVIELEELESASTRNFGLGSWRSYAAPSTDAKLTVPLSVDAGGLSRLRIRGWPRDRSTLVAEDCSVRTFLPLSAVDSVALSRPAFSSKARLKRAPSPDAETTMGRAWLLEAPFMGEHQSLRIGDEVEAACFGRARLVAIDGFFVHYRANLWFDGADASNCPMDEDMEVSFPARIGASASDSALRVGR